MKLFIPRVGDKIKLIENWTCSIYSEDRNKRVFEALGIEAGDDTQENVISITIPKGTVLNFARVYIRAPASDYDSVTLSVEDSPLKKLKKARFWVKATEASKIEYEHYSPDLSEIKKFNELFRVVARNIGLEDLQQLSDAENKQIIDEIIKERPQFLIKSQVTKEELSKITLDNLHYYSYGINESIVKKEIDQILIEETYAINLQLYSVLDHLLVRNEQTQPYEKLNELYDKYARGWRKPSFELGNEQILLNLKKDYIPAMLAISQATLCYLDKEIEVSDINNINRYIKKILEEPKTKAKSTKKKM